MSYKIYSNWDTIRLSLKMLRLHSRTGYAGAKTKLSQLLHFKKDAGHIESNNLQKFFLSLPTGVSKWVLTLTTV